MPTLGQELFPEDKGLQKRVKKLDQGEWDDKGVAALVSVLTGGEHSRNNRKRVFDLLGVLLEANPEALQRRGQLDTLLGATTPLIETGLSAPTPTWERRVKVVDDTDSDEDLDCSAGGVFADRIACTKPKKASKALQAYLQQAFSPTFASNPQKVCAGLILLMSMAEGCAKQLRPHFPLLLREVCSRLTHGHMKVRYFAIRCLAQLGGDIDRRTYGVEGRTSVIEQLTQCLKDPIQRVRCTAAASIGGMFDEGLCEGPREEYPGALKEASMACGRAVLKQFTATTDDEERHVLAGVIASGALVMGGEWDPLVPDAFEALAPALTKIVKGDKNEDGASAVLSRSALEATTCIITACGKDAVRPFIKPLADYVIAQLKLSPPSHADIARVSSLSRASTCIVEALKDDAAPILNSIVEWAYDASTLGLPLTPLETKEIPDDAEVCIIDDCPFTVPEDCVAAVQVSLQVLETVMESTTPATFSAFAEKFTQAGLNRLTEPLESIREVAASLLVTLLDTLPRGSQRTALAQQLLRPLVVSLQNDGAVDVLQHKLDALGEVLTCPGVPVPLSLANELFPVWGFITQQLVQKVQERDANESSASDVDIDDDGGDEAEAEDEEEEDDDESEGEGGVHTLVMASGVMEGLLMKTTSEEMPQLVPAAMQYATTLLAPSKRPRFTQSGMMLLSALLEFRSSECLPHLNAMASAIQTHIGSTDVGLAANALTAAGFLVRALQAHVTQPDPSTQQFVQLTLAAATSESTEEMAPWRVLCLVIVVDMFPDTLPNVFDVICPLFPLNGATDCVLKIYEIFKRWKAEDHPAAHLDGFLTVLKCCDL